LWRAPDRSQVGERLAKGDEPKYRQPTYDDVEHSRPNRRYSRRHGRILLDPEPPVEGRAQGDAPNPTSCVRLQAIFA
jgi:hypothetical protein